MPEIFLTLFWFLHQMCYMWLIMWVCLPCVRESVVGSSRLWHIYMYSPGYHKPWYLGFMSWITMLFAICFIELYLFCVCYCFEFVHILPWMVWNTVYKGADRELSMVTLGDNTVISDLNCKFYLFMKIVLPW